MHGNNTKYNVPSTTGVTFSASSETPAQFDAEGNKEYLPIAGLNGPPEKEAISLLPPACLSSMAAERKLVGKLDRATARMVPGFRGFRWFKMAPLRR